MDEVMQTSSHGGQPPDDESMNTSPILTRHSVRLRTPRPIASSSGWLRTTRQPSVAPAGDTSSSNPPVLNIDPERLNQSEEQTDNANLLPIEDRELIIHRPDNISVNLRVGGSLDEDSQVVSPVNETDDHSSDAANEAVSMDSVDSTEEANIVNSPPRISADSPSSQPVIELDVNQETVDVISENNTSESASSNEAPAAPDVENLPLAQRIRSPGKPI